MDYSDVFWFVDNILSKDLGIMSGEVYNLFESLEEIRTLKNLYYVDNREYLEKLNKMIKQ